MTALLSINCWLTMDTVPAFVLVDLRCWLDELARLDERINERAMRCADLVLQNMTRQQLRDIQTWRDTETPIHPYWTGPTDLRLVKQRRARIPAEDAAFGALVLLLFGLARYRRNGLESSYSAKCHSAQCILGRLMFFDERPIRADEYELMWAAKELGDMTERRVGPSSIPTLDAEAGRTLKRLMARDSDDSFFRLCVKPLSTSRAAMLELATDPHCSGIETTNPYEEDPVMWFESNTTSLTISVYNIGDRVKDMPRNSTRRLYEEHYAALLRHNHVPPAGLPGYDRCIPPAPAPGSDECTVQLWAEAIARRELQTLSLCIESLATASELAAALMAGPPLEIEFISVSSAEHIKISPLVLMRHLLPALTTAAPRCSSFSFRAMCQPGGTEKRRDAYADEMSEWLTMRRAREADEGWRLVREALAAKGSLSARLPLHSHSISHRLRQFLGLVAVPARVRIE